MFNLFRSKPHPHEHGDEAIWMTDAARIHGVCAEANALSNMDEKVVIFAASNSDASAIGTHAGPNVSVVRKSDLSPNRLTEFAQNRSVLYLMLVGLPDTPEAEESLLTKCKDLPFRIVLQLHLSLPELNAAGLVPSNMADKLKQLGGSEDEPITHRWVSSAIQKARRKKG